MGSVAYLAPEVLERIGHTKSIDWYQFGVLLYDLVVGIPPYYSKNKKELLSNITSGPLKIPKTMSIPKKKLIIALLDRDPNKRLGSGPKDA